MTASAITWLSLFFLVYHVSARVSTCPETSCGVAGPRIRYPFWLRDHQDDSCGYQGFDLSCDIDGNTTLVNFPFSGDFVFEEVDYELRMAWIKDPHGCLPKRLRTFNVTNSKLKAKYYMNFTFAYCSYDISLFTPYSTRVPCLSDQNYTVVATPTTFSSEESYSLGGCRDDLSWKVMVPHHDLDTFEDITERIVLTWDQPPFDTCESNDATCSNPGFPRKKQDLSLGARIGIFIIFGSPWFLCIIAITFYISRKSRSRTNSSASHPEQSQAAMEEMDLTAIESNYPKIQIDENGLLPRPSDNTCSICLCDYRSKEVIRVVPECNHYFHANCLDQWLKNNDTCPLCRNHLV